MGRPRACCGQAVGWAGYALTRYGSPWAGHGLGPSWARPDMGWARHVLTMVWAVHVLAMVWAGLSMGCAAMVWDGH